MGSQYRGEYPTHPFFAYRMLMCLNTFGGVLSPTEFNAWFKFPRQKRALRRFKRIAFRVYMQMHLKKSLRARLKGCTYRVRMRLLRKARRRLCVAWQSPNAYALYREAMRREFDIRSFAEWWSGLLNYERQRIVDTWARQLKLSVKDLWFDGRDYRARIYVQVSDDDRARPRIF
jgi:hypothetical protein